MSTITPTTHPTHTVRTGLRQALQRLDRQDEGAQSMEYAALAAGGCTAVGILIALLESDAVQDAIGNLIRGALEGLGTAFGGLLPF